VTRLSDTRYSANQLYTLLTQRGF